VPARTSTFIAAGIVKASVTELSKIV